MTRSEHLLDQIGRTVRRRFDLSSDRQLVLKVLRFEENCSKVESIVILSRHFNIPYVEALATVHNSSHWSDRKEVDEQLNEDFWTHAKAISGRSEDE